jgi:sulfide dehydrogenase cytochrome subunit
MLTMLKAFRSGERPSTVMGRLAKGYSDAEIDALAAYFSQLK